MYNMIDTIQIAGKETHVMNHKVRVLHAADFHLGSPFSGLSAQKAATRQGEQQATFRAVIDLCRTENIELLLLAGDVLDQLRLPAEQLRSVCDLFEGIPDTEIVIAPGNHDPYHHDSPYFTQKWPSNVHIFTGDFSSIHIPKIAVTVWGAAFTGIRAPRSLCPPGFTVDPSEDMIQIILLHGEMTETAAEKKSYNPILRDWIRDSKADYVALGHVHEKSGLCKAGQTFFAYPGCPEARGFDEPGPRGVYAGTISKRKVDLVYIPVNRRNYYCPDISVDGCGTQEQTEERILMFLKREYGDFFAREAYRITLTGALPPDYSPNLVNLRDRLAERVFAVRIKDRTSTRIDPEQLRRETSLRGAYADRMLAKMEAARTANDEVQFMELERALTVGLRAFEGEVLYCEDQ
jgi:exonuclease SbcD